MDVFYYWKEFEENVKNDMLGRFVSSKPQLEKLKDRYPGYIWTFMIPKGQGGQPGEGNCKLKLLARLKWSDTPLRRLKPTEKSKPESEIYYDHTADDSIFYEGTDSDEALDLVTGLMRAKFFSAFRSNFRGVNGVQVMEKALVDTFSKEIAHYPSSQFLTGIAKLKPST